ncbi:hypothetical protein OAP73_06035 [Methylophilaceae bacterium]|nr:hypothetical protein [Methylophilaceae bacterium]
MVDINKKKILGRGATATIFEAKKGSTLYAAKIFHPGTKVNVEKIEAMMENPPKIKSMKIDGLPFIQFAWPIELIKSNNTDVIGFLMPLIDLKNSFSLDFFYDAVLFHKLKSSNEVALTFKLAIAKNLAKVVADLHADNHFFIDLKPQNIRVAKGTHAVTLLDCDGFSIASKNGKRFPAELISTDYIAPEVTNKNESPVNLGEEQDLYALAVIIFQLLNKGTHPFQGIIKNNLKANTNDEKAAKGYYPHGLKPHPYIDPRPQSTHATLLESTRKLFDSAFSNSQVRRPKARIWAKHFDEILTNKLVVRCEKKSTDLSHLRFRDMDCPACYLEKINLTKSSSKTKASKPKSASSNRKKGPLPTAPKSSSTGGILWIGAFIVMLFLVYMASEEKEPYENVSNNSYERDLEVNTPPPNKTYTDNSSPTDSNKKSNAPRDCSEARGICHGVIQYENGTYTGRTDNGVRSGKGVSKYTSGKMKGCTHKGLYEDDQTKGLGIVSCSDGRKLQGLFNNGSLEGEGEAIYANGSRYQGNFKNGIRYGQGTYTVFKGDVISGFWDGGYVIGQGKIIYNNGDVYEGDLYEAKRHGWGTYTYADKTSITGLWENGKYIDEEPTVKQEDSKTGYDKEEEIRIAKAKEKMQQEHEARQENKGNRSGYVTPCTSVAGSCYGEVKFDDGSSYIGNWLNGKMEGKGTFYFTNGDRAEGTFINGALNGPGIYYYANDPNRGDRAEGTFINGVLNGPGIHYFMNAPYRGDRAEVPFIKGVMNGDGTYIRVNGERFPVNYKNGQPQGRSFLDWLNTKPELVPSQPSFGR